MISRAARTAVVFLICVFKWDGAADQRCRKPSTHKALNLDLPAQGQHFLTLAMLTARVGRRTIERCRV